MASTHPVPQPSHRGAPVQNSIHNQAASPPSREQLRSWWNKFGRRKDKPEDQPPPNQGIFGVPLAQSILYANVAISLTNEQGESFIYGYVPIVVAKCGVFLKEKATDVEGIFRLSGSAKRIKDLQTVFNSPDRYGKGLDWNGYTVHDAANILRRYLNQLPEPIVPLEFYEKFRDPLRDYQAKVDTGTQPQVMEHEEHGRAVVAYQKLITQLPALNRQLLLYILDLLAVFASKSDLNRMTAQNLAAIFQPGIISHPAHDMAPSEYRLSQDVLIFLIENQDNFLIGMTGTAMDEKTKDEVKSGPPSIQTPKAAIGRSASTASAGSSSVRRTAGVRRNGSLSSRTSRDRQSPSVSNPGTPVTPSVLSTAGATGSIGRSNTVPSKRSPAITAHRFQNVTDNPQGDSPEPVVETATVVPMTNVQGSTRGLLQTTDVRSPATEAGQSSTRAGPAVVENNVVTEPGASVAAAQDLKPAQVSIGGAANSARPTRERKVSNLLAKSPIFGPSDGQRDPNQKPRKLQKRRIPGSANESAQSSQASLQGDEAASFHTAAMTPNHTLHEQQPAPEAPRASAGMQGGTPGREGRGPGRNLVPPHTSPTPSQHSRGSVTDPSDLDALDDGAGRSDRHRNFFQRTNKELSPLEPPPNIGQIAGARVSNSSLGSNKPRKSFTGDSQVTQSSNFESTGPQSAVYVSSRESGEMLSPSLPDPEKRGLFSRMKAKLGQSKEARDAEKERAKSPPRLHGDHSRSSLSAFAAEHLSPRGRSFDRPRDEVSGGPAASSEQERVGQKTPQAPSQSPPYATNAAPIPVPVQGANEQNIAQSIQSVSVAPGASTQPPGPALPAEPKVLEVKSSPKADEAVESQATSTPVAETSSPYPGEVVSQLAAMNNPQSSSSGQNQRQQ